VRGALVLRGTDAGCVTAACSPSPVQANVDGNQGTKEKKKEKKKARRNARGRLRTRPARHAAAAAAAAAAAVAVAVADPGARAPTYAEVAAANVDAHVRASEHRRGVPACALC
jgi:hypothetical protein